MSEFVLAAAVALAAFVGYVHGWYTGWDQGTRFWKTMLDKYLEEHERFSR